MKENCKQITLRIPMSVYQELQRLSEATSITIRDLILQSLLDSIEHSYQLRKSSSC